MEEILIDAGTIAVGGATAYVLIRLMDYTFGLTPTVRRMATIIRGWFGLGPAHTE